ncbi:NUDIX domain-containing protein [Luteimonas viscosa]|uniref:NUDIX domain-containing protein n=1 Tax=Luteimonas viscosa TaxID=1132694 RepID=A0A5D4XR89_9GAMM|nr:NUDIX domain-containing protein [Luteimonas viscosa]TYT27079.1 NUDIX domain-containing protein [Luteimonas viscosa]
MHDCVGAMLVRDGRVLLGLRSADAAWLAGAWDIFGGHIEAGESPEDALRRELREELGVRAGALHPLGELTGDAPEAWRLRVFALHDWAGQPLAQPAGGHDAVRWCTLEEARTRLLGAHPGFATLLEQALRPRHAASIDPNPHIHTGTPR